MRKKQNISLVKIAIIIQIVLLLLPNAFALAKATESEETINIEYGENSKYSIQCFNEETKQWDYINSTVKYYINEEKEKTIAYCISQSSEIEENIVETNNVISGNTLEENDKEKITIEEQYIIESVVSLVDKRIEKILKNSYPNISLEELGVKNLEDAYMVVEQAIDYVLKNRGLEEFSIYYKIETEEEECKALEEEKETENREEAILEEEKEIEDKEEVILKEEKEMENREEGILEVIKKLINIAYNEQEIQIEEDTKSEEKILIYNVEKAENKQKFMIIINKAKNAYTENFVEEAENQQPLEEKENEEENIGEEVVKEEPEEEVNAQENENIEATEEPEEDIKEELPVEDEEQMQVEEKIENPEVYIKQECKNTVKANEEINYQFEIKNIGNTSISNFTWYSILPTNYATVVKMNTGEYNQEATYSIYYNTNKNSEYRLLKQNVNSKENIEIDLTNLNLEADEKIEEIKVCFDEVDAGFLSITKPSIYVKIDDEVENNTQIKSYAILDGYNQNYKVTCEDNIQSVVYNVEKKNKLPRTGF